MHLSCDDIASMDTTDVQLNSLTAMIFLAVYVYYDASTSRPKLRGLNITSNQGHTVGIQKNPKLKGHSPCKTCNAMIGFSINHPHL